MTRLLIISGAVNILLLYIAVSLFATVRIVRKRYKKLARSHVVLKSRSKSRKIISDARDTAQKIINESRLYRHEIEASVEDTIREVVNNGLKGAIENASGAIEKGIIEEISKSKAMVDKELLEYKAKKINEIDQKVSEVTKKILRDTLSKSLSESDQEKLILDALTKAKTNEIL
ncbi:MAG: hypothetical protein UV74_C0013G0015 [Candidatus Woesebacteria bacterium GW2011_GWB1_43_14]|uniref:ATP synthase subunit b n=1 Tax=Candidatus Woesebacteria bacterium GW2011_GWB1_43_14 TaxID=1618578 RepID=A0A0G1GDD0_9BACT|nr:MAG: hypothetical protein UV51_C0009G0018 [Candidatus Woesebacteria bacterium GW2011_GWC1_42_9]KKS96893.1 MAG: hypothetical protein UV74_C0013G0015 [Candidatus Woesebacteria bacterium GW2011_GWB1_43_14]